jgi:hypothetical protein
MKGTGTFFIGGNWKSNGTKDFVSKLVADLNSKPVPRDVEVVVAPIHIHLPIVLNAIKPPYQVAAQNCWVEQPGAYTGEVRRRVDGFLPHLRFISRLSSADPHMGDPGAKEQPLWRQEVSSLGKGRPGMSTLGPSLFQAFITTL